jgi:hypothetical protein
MLLQLCMKHEKVGEVAHVFKSVSLAEEVVLC